MDGIRFSLLCLFFGCVFPGNGDTIGWWRFSGVAGEVAGEGSEFPNLVDGTGVGSAKIVRYSDDYDNTDYQCYFTNAFENPFNCVRANHMGEIVASGIDSALTLQSNRKSAAAGYSTADGYHGYILKVEDPLNAMKNKSFTIEIIARDGADNTGRTLVSMPASDTVDSFMLTAGNGPGINAYGGFTVSSVLTQKNVVSNNNNQPDLDPDGSHYHHYALVVDGEAKTMAVYRDYTIYRSRTFSFEEFGEIAYKAGAPLVIGGSLVANRCCHAVQFEEVRYSNAALKPAEFLRKANDLSDHSALIHLSFDGTLDSTAYSDQLEPAVTGDDVPSFVSNTDDRRLTEYEGGKAIRRKNFSAIALRSDGVVTNYVKYSDAAMLSDESRLTVEFFLRSDGLPSYEHVLVSTYNTSNTSMNNGNGNGKPWLIVPYSKAGGYGLRVRMYGTGTGNSTIDTPRLEIWDGRWHHVAVTIDKAGSGNAFVKIYVDYELQNAGEESSYPLTLGWNTVPLGISGGWANAPNSWRFNGDIDELRISKGVLPVGKFMKMTSEFIGLFLSVR